MHAVQSLLKSSSSSQRAPAFSLLRNYRYQPLRYADGYAVETGAHIPDIRYSSPSYYSTLCLLTSKIRAKLRRCMQYVIRICILVLLVLALYHIRLAFLSLSKSSLTAAPDVALPAVEAVRRVHRKMTGANSTSTLISMRRLLCVALEAAERGGREVRAVQESAQLNQRSKGGIRNPVTDGDMRSHWAMYAVLRGTFPTLNIVSEEQQEAAAGGEPEGSKFRTELTQQEYCASNVYKELTEGHDEHVPSKDVAVWIDPLDATQEYTENLLQYVTTMIGIAVKGRAVAGVVHKPFQNESYWAWEGRVLSESLTKTGATPKNSGNLQSKVNIIVSRSHAGPVAEFCRDALEGREFHITSAGGAGYKGLEVALGNQDIYIHSTKIKKWDLCAPNALINALGGKLTTLLGEDVDYADTRVDGEHEVVKDGFVAAVHDHQYFLERFKNVKLNRR